MKSYIRAFLQYHIYIYCICGSVISHETRLQELEPIMLTKRLGDIIELPIPRPNIKTSYINLSVTNPNGDKVALENDLYCHRSHKGNNTKELSREEFNNNLEYDEICHEYSSLINKYRLNNSNKRKRIKIKKEINGESTDCNEEMIEIGPLNEDDYGNWVVSSEFEDENGNPTEMFRVISVIIIEKTEAYPSLINLKVGDIYKVRLKHDIHNMESCVIVPPKSTVDRYYERDLNNLNRCGYVITNVTTADQGIWKIVAVGKIVYTAKAILNIGDLKILTSINE